MAKEKTVVIFRKYPDGEVIALFPEIPHDRFGVTCSSYMHNGQHGAADCVGVDRQTKPASPKEYASLKRELTGIGYALDIKKKFTRPMETIRHANALMQR
jgi:hypothetical protein